MKIDLFAFTVARRVLMAVAMIACCTLADSATATAQEQTAPSAIGQMFSGLNPANWKMPSFGEIMPGKQETARIKEKKDGLFTEVRKSASNSWTKTKEIFNPQKLNPVNFLPAANRTPVPNTEPEKPGFFKSLFTPQPVQKETTTVNDFLGQPRPNP